MKRTLQYTLITFFTVLAIACGDSRKEKLGSIGDKKAQLEKLKKDQATTAAEVKKLEDEIAKADTSAGKQQKAKLIAISPVLVEDFSHYIDLQGKIDADNISYVAPRGMPGIVKAIYVQEGQFVKKGQLLVKLDDAIARQQIAAAEKGVDGVKTQLAFAKNIYERQKNLWDQNIGSEVQLITAKNNVEALENGLQSANENVKLAREQLKTTLVYADVAGIADQVNVKVGESFTGFSAEKQAPQIRIVNNSTLKAVIEIPENYMTRVRVGSPVEVTIPDMNKTFNSVIKLSSQTINPSTRTFTVEANVPGGSVRPNAVASVRIKDYSAPNAIVIPVNLVQTDDKGKYVYVAEKDSRGRMVAVKKPVVIGESYGDKIEIKGGLQTGMQLISQGYQTVYDGQVVITE
jgi:membrane fusion protein, multidrug efflux system